MTRSYWLELSVPQSTVMNKYKEYFGDSNFEFTTRDSAVKYLISVRLRLYNGVN
jgi:hypothetical protein